MPNWKKVIVSGSNAVLNNITASGHMTVLDGGFTANNAASTELEVVGDISASGTITCDTIVASNLNFGDDFSYTNLSIEDEINTLHATTNEHSAHLLKLKNTSDTVETFAGISFDVGSEDDADSIAASIKAVNASSNPVIHGAHLVFSTNNAGDDGCTERMRITSGGFIGIGDFDTVAQPLQNLHIKGSSAQMIFEENTTDYLRIGTGMTDKDSFIGFDDTNMLHIGTFAGISDTSMNTKLLISQTGLVGIGNDVLDPPINRLHVRHGGVDGDNGIVLTRNDGTVSVNETLGGIGFDSEDGGTQSSIFEASAYIAGFASQAHTGTERGGYLTLGTKAINSNVNVNAIERMRITDSGRIGIGTGTPMNSLQVNNSGSDFNNGIMLVRADSTTSANELLGGIGFDSTDGDVPSSILEASAYIAGFASINHSTTQKGGYLSFGTTPDFDNDNTVSDERMRINADGTIQIYEDFYLKDGSTGGDNLIRLYDSSDDGVIDVYANNSITTRIYGNGNSYFNGGRVGIGDSSPVSQLHIEIGDDNFNGPTNDYSNFCLALRNQSDLIGAFAGIAFDVSTETDVDAIGAAIKAVNDNAGSTIHDCHLTFHTNDLSDDDLFERMRIQDNGRIVIGPRTDLITPPTAQLFISSSNNSTALEIDCGDAATFQFKGNSNSGYTTEFDINNTGLQIGHGSSGRTFDLQTNSTNRIRIESNGQLKFYNIAASSGTNYVKWNSSTKAITYQSSTRKVKKNIVALTSESYNSILDLNPVSFTRKDDNIQYFGFIAEECANAHIRFATYGPDYVFDESGSLTPLSASLDENGAKGYQDYQLESNDKVPVALDTDAILAAAVAKIQELEARIQELES